MPEQRALIVGVGGLGCPAALALAEAGVHLTLVDDDEVELTNLHRQVLFDAADLGAPKLQAAARALARRGVPSAQLTLVEGRLLPETALELVNSADVVLEGVDNFASKFLAADACHLVGRPLIHGAALRWQATVWAVSGAGRPCYRCLFEDLPEGPAENCDSAGVMGPLVGFAGALMADLALCVLRGDPGVFGSLLSYDGLRDRLRAVPVSARPGCPLCGAAPTVSDLTAARYLGSERCLGAA
ncbi:MAG: HesA/MoeB/ThiF family protein [Polyangiaceae bacterium]|nr:HesA/MoeB/ThiF family protein [Polyangiaceae bacterium]